MTSKREIHQKYIVILWRGLSLFVISLLLVVSVHSVRLQFTSDEKDFIFLVRILKQQTKGIEDDAERLRIMTNWLHENVKSGEYPPHYNPKGVANVIRAGLGNCGFQACNIVCFAELLGLQDHQLVHSREEWGAPGIHTLAEIWVSDRWIIYDPDKWQVITNNNGELVGINDIMMDTTCITNKMAARWIYETISKEGNRVTSSWQKTPFPFGRDAYRYFEIFGMPYIYFKKLLKKSVHIVIEAVILFGTMQIFLIIARKRKKSSI